MRRRGRVEGAISVTQWRCYGITVLPRIAHSRLTRYHAVLCAPVRMPSARGSVSCVPNI